MQFSHPFAGIVRLAKSDGKSGLDRFQSRSHATRGAVGAQNGNGEWEVTCSFAYSPNTVGRVIGDIAGIAKKGWEYLWVLYQDEADDAAKRVVQRPVAVYVEQVLEYVDLNLLQLGS